MKQPCLVKRGRWLCYLCFGLGLAAFPAQRALLGPAKGLKVPDYFPTQPGQPGRLKSLLLGGEARRQPNGQIPIKALRLEIYRADGPTNLIAEADECVYDQTSQSAAGEREVRAHSGDERVTISGQGFLWQQTNSSLAISNQVRTLVKQEQPINIRASRFQYTGASSQVSYHGQVSVQDPQMEMTSENLTFHLPEAGRPLDQAVAETNVVIVNLQEQLRASGQRAEYTDRGGVKLIELTGDPVWRRGRREGKADRLQYDRLHQSFAAFGRSYTKLPRNDLEQPGFFLASLTATNPQPVTGQFATNQAGTNQFVEVFADESHLRSNDVAFLGHVQARELASLGPPASLSGGSLLLTSAPPAGRLERMIVEEQVVIKQGDSGVASERMVYTKTNELAEFTGHPTWQSGPHEGSADRLWFHTGTRVLEGRGHGRLKLHLGGGEIPLGLPGATNAVVSTNRYLLVSAPEYELKSGWALFRGQIEAEEYVDELLKSKLNCGQLAVKFTAPSHRVEQVLAEQQVRFTQGVAGVTNGPTPYQRLSCEKLTLNATNGQLLSLVGEQKVGLEKADFVANGERLYYDAQTDQAELTGDPVVTTPRGSVRGPAIIYDHKQEKVFILTGWKGTFKVKPISDKPRGKKK